MELHACGRAVRIFIMNFKIILRMLGSLFLIEALLLIPSVGLAIYDGEPLVLKALVITMLLLVILALLIRICCKCSERTFYAREGFLLVAMAWIVLSAFGALPFYLSGEIPHYVDAFFEIVSGFTTTGSSILTDVEAMSRPLLYWRSFSHWLGGMGILVFMLAIVPSARGNGNSFHLLRAESPGPSIEKLTPKMQHHTSYLYAIYIFLTLLCLSLLLVGGMPFFDSLCITFGTAGTGGFGIRTDSMASYPVFCQGVVTVFMALFGVNFNIYFLLLFRRWKEALLDEELRVYLGIMLGAIAIVTLNVSHLFHNLWEAFHHVAFSVSSVMTTTGYATADFDKWPEFSRGILMVLMLFGASAGSTAGGIKVARLVMMAKSAGRELQRMLHPRSVMSVRMNNRPVGEHTLRGISVFLICYLAILVASFLLISLDGFSLETNLSAVIACLNNIGPGLGMVGPTGSFAAYSPLSKMVLSADMLLGRLEIFPLVILFNPRSWNRAT